MRLITIPLLSIFLVAHVSSVHPQQPIEPAWYQTIQAPVEQLVDPMPFYPMTLAQSADGARHLLGANRLVTVDANGSVRETPLSPRPAPTWATVRDDGTLLILDSACRITAMTTTGEVLWHTGQGSSMPPCSRPAIDSHETTWLLTNEIVDDRRHLRILAIGPNGQKRSLSPTIPTTYGGYLLPSVALGGNGQVVIAHQRDDKTFEVFAIGEAGARLWSWAMPLPLVSGRAWPLNRRPNGEFDLLTYNPALPAPTRWQRRVLGPDGQLQIRHDLLAGPPGEYSPVSALVAPDGHVHTLASTSTELILTSIPPNAAAGSQLTIAQPDAESRLWPLADGRILWTRSISESGQASISEVDVLSRTGTLQTRRELAGSVLLAASADNGAIDLVSTDGQVYHLRTLLTNGDAMAATVSVLPERYNSDVESVVDQQGNTFVLTWAANDDHNQTELIRVDNTGTIAWRRILPGHTGPGIYSLWSALTSCGPEHICLFASGLLMRVKKADGTTSQETTIRDRAFRPAGFANGNVLVDEGPLGPFFPLSESFYLVSSSGEVSHPFGWVPRYFRLAFDESHGMAVLEGTEQGLQLKLLDSTGQSHLLLDNAGDVFRAISQSGLSATAAMLVSENELFAIVPDEFELDPRTTGGKRLVKIGEGALAWSVDLPNLPFHDGEDKLARLGNGDVVVLLKAWPDEREDFAMPGVGIGHSILARYSSDGELRWSRGVSIENPESAELLVGPNDQIAIVYANRQHEIEFVIHEPEAGTSFNKRWLPCGDTLCPNHARLLPSGRLILSTTTHHGGSWPVIAVDNLFTRNFPFRINQLGLSGLWYDAHAPGQGFSLSLFPQSRRFFMPWYTFGPIDAGDVDNQRWYSMEGEDDGGSPPMTAVPLQIMAHTGRFGDSNLSGTPVGTAMLTMGTCQRLLLDYRFDDNVNDGAGGTMVLDRLLPLAEECRDRAGTWSPAPGTAVTNLDGLWYDPGQPGQGLHLFHQTGPAPAFFGAWYTFNPTTTDDPAQAPHWFTLQVPAITDDGLVVAIMQTLGGALHGAANGHTYRIGEARLQPRSCDRLDLHYRFEGDPRFEIFTDQSGVIELHRLGACP